MHGINRSVDRECLRYEVSRLPCSLLTRSPPLARPSGPLLTQIPCADSQPAQVSAAEERETEGLALFVVLIQGFEKSRERFDVVFGQKNLRKFRVRIVHLAGAGLAG